MTTTGPCPTPPTHDSPGLTLSTLLLVLILATHIPQQILLGHTREGVSPWYLFLGCLVTLSTLANILLLQSWPMLSCCAGGAGEWPTRTCAEQAMGVVQLAAQALLSLATGLGYLVWFPAHLRSPPPTDSSQDSEYWHEAGPPPMSVARRGLWGTSLSLALDTAWYLGGSATVVAATLLVFARGGVGVAVVATVFGCMAVLFLCVQMAPQVEDAWRGDGGVEEGQDFDQHFRTWGGNASLVVKVGTDALLAYTLASRQGVNVSTYLSFCVGAACVSGVLVVRVGRSALAGRCRRFLMRSGDRDD